MSKPLVTHQTGPEGIEVKKVMIAHGVDIEHEYYVSVVLDRDTHRPMIVASSQGGVDIEDVAENHPDAILKQLIHPLSGLQTHQARTLAYKLGFHGKQIRQATEMFLKLAKMFEQYDADMIEINPLVVTPACQDHPDGQVLAIDAKISFNSSALYRQKDIATLHDPSETPANELQAEKFGLNYIQLEGDIGCMVNGAGLAMATMDTIQLSGRSPANFLDVGGSATQEAITEAFRIILSDKNVKGLLVNIFGGIMQCDKIARAIIGAANEIGFSIPLVVRLEGTNVAEAQALIEDAKSQMPYVQMATDLSDAVTLITQAVN